MLGIFGAAGNMASAIINGIIEASVLSLNEICLFDINMTKLEKYRNSDAEICSSANELVARCDVIIICVKPQTIDKALEMIKPSMTEEKCIVSIVAGVTTETINNAFDFNCKIVRVMPNTPLMLGCGASGVCKNRFVTDSELRLVLNIFGSSGVYIECDEEQMNTVTAVSGSGPAYVFKFAKAVCDEAERLGLERDAALKLFAKTLEGSAKMLTDSGMTDTELIKMVTSPNGTTQAANESFDSDGFEQTVCRAVAACKRRADELSGA